MFCLQSTGKDIDKTTPRLLLRLLFPNKESKAGENRQLFNKRYFSCWLNFYPEKNPHKLQDFSIPINLYNCN